MPTLQWITLFLPNGLFGAPVPASVTPPLDICLGSRLNQAESYLPDLNSITLPTC